MYIKYMVRMKYERLYIDETKEARSRSVGLSRGRIGKISGRKRLATERNERK